MTASIRILKACKTFGATRAVRDLELEVPQGSLCGFLGPNGAGKSTTIRMIMSIIYPDSGSIEVLGGNALKAKDRIGYLPEERGVYRKMKVGEFLRYIARLKGVDAKGLNKRIDDWLQRVDLPDAAAKKCEELSKGMQQKVQFLAAIIHEPELLILDEPFSGLDPVNAELLRHLIEEQNRAGTTIIFSTHVLHQAQQMCERIFLINHGVKILDATLDEIAERYDPRTIVAEPVTPPLEVAGVSGVHATHPLENNRFEVELEAGAESQQVMQSILEAQPQKSVALRRLSLDEVFVQLVRRDEGIEAADRAREQLLGGADQ